MSEFVDADVLRQNTWDRCEAIMDAIGYLRGLAPSLQKRIADGMGDAPPATSDAVQALLAAQDMFIDRLADEVEVLQRSSAG